MCDITPNQRRKRYKKLRKAGHTVAWSRRARDFSENHYTYHSESVPKAINTNNNTIDANDSKDCQEEQMKRVQETVSDEAKANLIAFAEAHKLTQGEALDAILLKVNKEE